MSETRPFVINRKVVKNSDKLPILIDVSEYDGMLEEIDVKPLNRLTAAKAIQNWERDEDYFIDNEYGISFLIEYQKEMGGKMIPTTARWELPPNLQNSVPKFASVLESTLRSVIIDLDRPGTVVINLSISGKTARKMWYRVSTEIVDFTQV